jgi:predicted nucleotidyltransferase
MTIQDLQGRRAMTPKIQIILTELRHRLEALYGERLVRMVLFGSQARGDAEPGSDIDVLVVLKGPVSPCEEITKTSEIVADLSLQFTEVISCVFMDEARFLHRNGPLLRNIRREGVPI